ncbi:DUF1080 domain-containing protein [Tamlana crocina]
MHIKPIITIVIFSIMVLNCKENPSKNNETTDKQWISLFNGKNLDGWIPKFYKEETGTNYLNTFRISNGSIQVNYDNYERFDERYGHLFYKTKFSSYHLKFKYQFTSQWMEDAPHFTYRNSGIMFHAQDPKTILKNQNWPISVEYQILAESKENEHRPTGNMCSPGTDIVINNAISDSHCVRSSSKTYKWNEWVNGELIVYKDSLIQHFVNGEKVLEYSKPQIGGNILIRDFDPSIKINGKLLKEGYIGLQAEGQGINFKDIEIKILD